MPKMKTHKGAAKRIKVTGSGKLKRAHSAKSHLREKKSSKQKRAFVRMEDVFKGDAKRVKRLIPYK